MTLKTVLTQTLREIEVIVVDDGNSETERKIIKQAASTDSRIRVVSNSSNLGLSKSLVAGCAAAQSQYIARVDNMDLMVPSGRLERQYHAMEANPGLVLIGGNLELVDCINLERFRTTFAVDPADNPLEVMKQGPCFHHPTVMLRKCAYDRVGGYNCDLDTEEDFDLWRRMLRIGDGMVMRDIFSIATMRAESISVAKNNTQIVRKIFRIIDEEKPTSGLWPLAQATRRIALELPKFLIPKRYRLKLRHRRWGKYLGPIAPEDVASLKAVYRFYERQGYFRDSIEEPPTDPNYHDREAGSDAAAP